MLGKRPASRDLRLQSRRNRVLACPFQYSTVARQSGTIHMSESSPMLGLGPGVTPPCLTATLLRYQQVVLGPRQADLGNRNLLHVFEGLLVFQTDFVDQFCIDNNTLLQSDG